MAQEDKQLQRGELFKKGEFLSTTTENEQVMAKITHQENERIDV